ncbi:MAG: Stress-induced bacterial acidophilic repeat motif protein [Synergistetes bacterium ADurb.BinA166]|nr:MAG: Stress-induced bacterial acidophilic repeat motif protein [Synergistetes bacterium ADurb.BinA166]
MGEKKEKKPRGFAAMDPEVQRRIASAGGKSAHRAGTAHHWSKETAAEAGRKGGRAAQERRAAKRLEAEIAKKGPEVEPAG